MAALVHGAPPRELALRAASGDPNYPAYHPDIPGDAQPIRGNLGATIIGPQNHPVQQQNPDILAPPTTDHGNV
jgi:hypothetical protein